MKKLLSISVICMAAMMAACGGKQQSASEDADSLAVENIVEEETTSPDYVMLNLKGKVKSYEMSGFWWEIIGPKVEFDETGRIIKINGETPNLERNDKGQIIKYSYKEEYDSDCFDDGSQEYFYDENGVLVKMTTHSFWGDWDTVFKRDEGGNIVAWENLGPDGDKGTNKYIEFDEQGNWTKQGDATRKLTYWE